MGDELEKVGELANEVFGQIMDGMKEAAKDRWDAISDEDKDKAKKAAARLARLEAESRLGMDVDEESLKVVQATIKNWTVVGAIEVSMFQTHFWEGVAKAAKTVGSGLVSILGPLAGAALKGLVSGGGLDDLV